MKTVRILETFDGFPNGVDAVRYTKGEAPTLTDDFADLLIGKGLAKASADVAPATPDSQESAS